MSCHLGFDVNDDSVVFTNYRRLGHAATTPGKGFVSQWSHNMQLSRLSGLRLAVGSVQQLLFVLLVCVAVIAVAVICVQP